MDLLARRMLHKVVHERRDRGLTTVMVSHALPDVAQLCDRVAVLSGGRLTYLGWIDELLDHGDAAHSFEEALEPLYAGECS
jgi:ABC-2 type transport system ATP-binding protein